VRILPQGFADITKLVVKAGGHMETMLGPAGFGDIVMTCYGSQSRNGCEHIL
jgi:glycerol-3-phosphate dehydrogenase (NAD(P)+)